MLNPFSSDNGHLEISKDYHLTAVGIVIAITTWLVSTRTSISPDSGQRQETADTKAADAKEQWTLEDRRAYARRNDDPSKWDLQLLKLDLDTVRENANGFKPGLSDYPSPVAAYDWGYGMIYNLKTQIGERTLKGVTIGYAIDKYHIEPAAIEGDFYAARFNLLILTDHLAEDKTAVQLVSRNYPHYLATGSQLTSQGRIDWVQLATADNRNLAIISQRVFDLEFGKTIVVIPHDDGSLRFLQLENSPITFPTNPFDEVGKARVEAYFKELNLNTRLLESLKEDGVISSEK